jgi:hypothetical protein
MYFFMRGFPLLLMNEAQRQRIMVTAAIRGLDRAYYGQNGCGDHHRYQEKKPDNNEAQGDAAEAVDDHRNMKIQSLAGVGRHKFRLIPHRQINDQGKQNE